MVNLRSGIVLDNILPPNKQNLTLTKVYTKQSQKLKLTEIPINQHIKTSGSSMFENQDEI